MKIHRFEDLARKGVGDEAYEQTQREVRAEIDARSHPRATLDPVSEQTAPVVIDRALALRAAEIHLAALERSGGYGKIELTVERGRIVFVDLTEKCKAPQLEAWVASKR